MARTYLRGQRELFDREKCPRCGSPTRERTCDCVRVRECLVCPWWMRLDQVAENELGDDRRS